MSAFTRRRFLQVGSAICAFPSVAWSFVNPAVDSTVNPVSKLYSSEEILQIVLAKRQLSIDVLLVKAGRKYWNINWSDLYGLAWYTKGSPRLFVFYIQRDRKQGKIIPIKEIYCMRVFRTNGEEGFIQIQSGQWMYFKNTEINKFEECVDSMCHKATEVSV